MGGHEKQATAQQETQRETPNGNNGHSREILVKSKSSKPKEKIFFVLKSALGHPGGVPSFASRSLFCLFIPSFGSCRKAGISTG